MGERVRFTVSAEQEVLDAFTELAQASGQSVSRVVGDWLRDTTEAARFVKVKVNEVRMAPAAALAELAIVQDRAAAETRALAARWNGQERKRSATAGAAAEPPRRAAGAAEPPCSPTGVKTQRKGRKP